MLRWHGWRSSVPHRCGPDESADALDVDGVQVVNELLHAHLARGGATLLTSHHAPGPSAPEMSVFDLDRYA